MVITGWAQALGVGEAQAVLGAQTCPVPLLTLPHVSVYPFNLFQPDRMGPSWGLRVIW